MNGYSSIMQQQQYPYMTQCSYMQMCPVRNQCPVCPYGQERNEQTNPGYYGNMNVNIEYYKPIYPVASEEQYQRDGFEGYGYDNLYPPENIDGNSGHNNFIYDDINYHHISPQEHITTPWDNNRRYENNFANMPPLPERTFG